MVAAARGPLVACVLAFAVFATALVVGAPAPTGDEGYYALEAFSIAKDGDVDLANDFADPERVRRATGLADYAPQAFAYGDSPALRSVHAPGLPLLLAPVAAAGGSTTAMRMVIVLAAALAAAVLLDVLRRAPVTAQAPAALRWAVWAVTAFAVPMLGLATQLYPEMPAVLLVLLAVRGLVVEPTRAAVAVGALSAALLPWLHVRLVVVAAALVVALAVRALRRGGRRRAAAVVAVAVVSALAQAVAFEHWYGSPLPSAPYAPIPAHLTVSSAYRYALGGVLDPDFGWLPFAPVAALGFVGLGTLVRCAGRAWTIGTVCALGYLVIVGSTGAAFPGSSYPARLQLVVVPLAALPTLVLAVRHAWARWALAGLGALTLAISVQAIPRLPDLLPGPPRPGLVEATSSLWPSFAVPQRIVQWTPTLERSGARLHTGPSPVLPAALYLLRFSLRAAPEPAPSTRLATVRLRGRTGEPLVTHAIDGGQVAAGGGSRAYVLPFHLARGDTLRLGVALTGRAPVDVSGPAVTSIGDTGAATASRALPDLGRALAWLVVLLAGALAAGRTGRRPTPGGIPCG